MDEAPNLVRAADRCVSADYGYQGAAKRHETDGDEHLSRIEWRIAARKGALKTMPEHDLAGRVAQGRCTRERGASVPDRQAQLRVHQDPLPRVAKNLNHLHMLFASATWLMRARAVALTQTRA
ncbi:hypothetical protein [Flexivirga meconopsidis]|uniref:hypothetical protein n=1 Tax=Flexivirga meconopsidis TaxID=2977121 RepID=UPI00224034AF|nr:hypothetical protein [Flexivirga meconopsidis]